jgi:hypothetical protein
VRREVCMLTDDQRELLIMIERNYGEQLRQSGKAGMECYVDLYRMYIGIDTIEGNKELQEEYSHRYMVMADLPRNEAYERSDRVRAEQDARKKAQGGKQGLWSRWFG